MYIAQLKQYLKTEHRDVWLTILHVEEKEGDQCLSVRTDMWSLVPFMSVMAAIHDIQCEKDRWCVERDIKPGLSAPERSDTSDPTSVIKGWCLTNHSTIVCRSRARATTKDNEVQPRLLESCFPSYRWVYNIRRQGFFWVNEALYCPTQLQAWTGYWTGPLDKGPEARWVRGPLVQSLCLKWLNIYKVNQTTPKSLEMTTKRHKMITELQNDHKETNPAVGLICG